MEKESDLKKEAIVVGRRFFIDLWGLLGMEPLLCERPSDIKTLLPQILSRRDLACVMVEDSWFDQIAPTLRSKLEDMEIPLWVPLPTVKIGELD